MHLHALQHRKKIQFAQGKTTSNYQNGFSKGDFAVIGRRKADEILIDVREFMSTLPAALDYVDFQMRPTALKARQ